MRNDNFFIMRQSYYGGAGEAGTDIILNVMHYAAKDLIEYREPTYYSNMIRVTSPGSQLGDFLA